MFNTKKTYKLFFQQCLLVVQAPGLRQLNVAQEQDQQQLMGSPRIHPGDELSGGLILAPGSETTASVSEPLADIAGGKSGTDAEIENPYDQMPAVGASQGPSGVSHVQQQQQSGQESGMHNQSGTPAAQDVNSQQQGPQQGDEYSEQQQTQQASSGCKQS